MADPTWRTKVQKVTKFEWNSVLAGFRGPWLRFLIQNSGIPNGEFDIAHQKANSYLCRIKLCTRVFRDRWLWTWTQNSEIQNGGSNLADQDIKWIDLDEPRYSGDFEYTLITNVNLVQKFTMVDPIWRTRIVKTAKFKIS